MSATLADVRGRVLTLCRCHAGNDGISPLEVDDEINRALQDLALDGIVGKTWTDSYVSLVANDYDYTLPTASSTEYGGILAVRRNSDGYPLTKRTPATLEEMYNRASAARGKPEDYSLTELTDQSVVLKVGPTPGSANPPEALDIMFEKLPGRVSADSDTIGLSRAGLACLELMVAAYVVEKLPEDQLASLGLSPNAGASFMRRAAVLRAAELSRFAGLELPNDIQRFEA